MTAPFVAIAQIEKTVETRMVYAMVNCRTVSRYPALPTMYPIRRKRRAENMERETGAKTPLMVLRMRWSSATSSSSRLLRS